MRSTDRWMAIALLLAAHAGCGGSKPSRYYLLSTTGVSNEVRQGLPLSIGIGPISFPEYLDRPQIVTRASDHRLRLAEYDRWAEPLDENFTSVLTENLSALLSTDSLYQYPWKQSTAVDYQVIVSISRFDATDNGEATLSARWTINSADGRMVVAPRATQITENAASRDYEAIVEACSRAVARLSREVAAAVAELRGERRSASGDK